LFQVNFNNKVYDIGTLFNTSTSAWTPPSGRISISARVRMTGTITAGSNCAAEIFKDGVAVAVAAAAAPNTNVAGASIYFEDQATGSNAYTCQAVATTTSGTVTVDGTVANTWFEGHVIDPTAGATGGTGATGATGATGGLTLISSVSATAGTTGVISFTSISASYKELRITMHARGTTAAPSTNLQVRFNSDATSTYGWQRILGASATASASDGGGATGLGFCGTLIGASGTTGYASILEVIITDYTGTTFFKNYLSTAGYAGSNASGVMNIAHISGTWANTAAITQVDITALTGNFLTGSIFNLWGWA
jgi:hypothetical protein